MTGVTPTSRGTSRSGDEAGRDARKRPLTTFLLFAFPIGWATLAAPAVLTSLPGEPFLVAFLLFGLLGPTLLVTRWADGPGAVRLLLSRAVRWRFGIARWAVVLFALPVLTLAIAALSGSLRAPEQGWLAEAGTYLLFTLVVGALLGNIWEETAWGGFVQTRLMARHGLLVGSLLTAPLFAGMHIPMQFYGDWTWSGVGQQLVILFAMAPVYRYLLGMLLLDTGGSVLAIGVLHASWNNAGKIGAVDGAWQIIAAVLLLTVLLAVARRSRRAASPVGRDAERAAAASWLTERAVNTRTETGPGRGRGRVLNQR
jgi:membrane protease YdiL (CAAX protease family)